jgi:hypothetical protein
VTVIVCCVRKDPVSLQTRQLAEEAGALPGGGVGRCEGGQLQARPPLPGSAHRTTNLSSMMANPSRHNRWNYKVNFRIDRICYAILFAI